MLNVATFSLLCSIAFCLQVELLLNLEELVPPIVGVPNAILRDSKAYIIFEWLWEVTSSESKVVSS